MPSYRTGTVTAIIAERAGIQRVEVDGDKAYVLTELIGPVAVGDRVVMNTTAVDLDLGTGGWHVVHWNLERDAWSKSGAGHEMKLRYTSLQAEVGVSADLPRRIGTPVVACFLHSQVALVAAACKRQRPDATVAYVMTDGGALPMAVSDLVPTLRSARLVDVTVTAGHAFGGEREAVNVAHALEVAGDHDVVVVGMGPGSLGTNTELGFSGLEVADILNAAAALDLSPIVALRYSEADERERHQGVSHHATTALRITHARATVPIPRGEAPPHVGGHDVIEVDVPDLSDLGVTSMGRSHADDPKFFAYAAAAGVAAANLLVD
ncbi:MAG: DUF3866 family protein [Actinobacteria bacterium]|nr:DUF3866 family protein [Actinomycetota bacterium]